MPIARFQMPDGRIARFEVPEGTTPEQAKTIMEAHFANPQNEATTQAPVRPSLIQNMEKGFAQHQQNIKQLNFGMLKGASNIGSTLLTPIDKMLGIEGRRDQVTSGLQDMGANPNSGYYNAGELGAEIAGTAGLPGAIGGQVARVAPALSPLATAISTSGMKAGNTTGLANLGLRATGGAISGGSMAGLINPEKAKEGAAIGALMPLAVKAAGDIGKGMGGGVRKMFGKVEPDVKDLANKAKQLGIDIPADRLVNSRPLNATAASLNYVPLSGRAATEAKMESQLNKALSKTFGQNTDNITMGLRKASKDLGGKFETTLKNNKVVIDNTFMDDLAQNLKQAGDELAPKDYRIIRNQVKNILQPYKLSAQVGDAIDGQAAYNLKKGLDRIGRRNSNEAYYAREVQKSLMGALNRSLGTDEAKAFATVRQQYGNMLDLRSLAKNGAEGGVSVARLANMRGINNPQLQDIADIAAQFVKPREAQHGAMQRVALGLLGAGGAATGYAPAVAGGMLAGRGINSLLNSEGMKNVLLNNPSRGLLSPQVQQLMYRTAPVLNAH